MSELSSFFSLLRPSAVLLLSLWFSTASFCFGTEIAASSPRDLATGLQRFYDQVTSISFSFEQRARSAPGRERRGSGKGFFFRSGDGRSMMRWDYDDPDRQVIINNGKSVLIYTAKDRQMVTIPREELQDDILFSFFSGGRQLLDEFSALPPATRYRERAVNGRWRLLQLRPRTENSRLAAIHLWIDGDFLIHRVVFEDHFNSVTELDLKDIRINSLAAEDPGKASELFSFTPPPGTEIISNQ